MIIYREEIRRFGIRIAYGRYALEDGRWSRRWWGNARRRSAEADPAGHRADL